MRKKKNMKLIQKTVIICIVALIGHAALAKVELDYQITKSERDSSLADSQAVFEIFFSLDNSDFAKSTKKLRTSVDGIRAAYSSDSLGRIIFNVAPGSHQFKFYYTSQYYEVQIDKIEILPGFRTLMKVEFSESWENLEADKPVIYVYAQKPTNLNIQVDLKGEFQFTYPKYDTKNGWNIMAHPDGTIEVNNKSYDYLFWEGKMSLNPVDIRFDQGFITSNESLIPFFEDKLSSMGLNSSEQEDFITYWAPLMSKHEKCYVHFMFEEEYKPYAALITNPKPDHLFRVFMVWTPLEADENPDIIPQSIDSFKRGGLTIVEWGGSKIDKSIIRKNIMLNY